VSFAVKWDAHTFGDALESTRTLEITVSSKDQGQIRLCTTLRSNWTVYRA